MSSVEEIEQAVSQLAPSDLAVFRRWFEQFEADLFDRAIERDALSGKLDRLAEQAIAQHRKGFSREL
jgi:hypothetical protein